MFDRDLSAAPGVKCDPAGELRELLVATAGVESFLQRIVVVASDTIGGDVFAAVTMTRGGRLVTVAASDARAAQSDEAQYAHDGPCLTAMGTGDDVLIEDLAIDQRFNAYRALGLALGLRSCLSLPLESPDHGAGVLNLYSRRAHAFGPTEQATARIFAADASWVMHLTARLAQHVEITDQLRAALTSRATIDQTIGIIMAQNRCDADTAFAVLRAASQHRNVKLRVVATEIITAVGHTPPALPRPFQDLPSPRR